MMQVAVHLWGGREWAPSSRAPPHVESTQQRQQQQPGGEEGGQEKHRVERGRRARRAVGSGGEGNSGPLGRGLTSSKRAPSPGGCSPSGYAGLSGGRACSTSSRAGSCCSWRPARNTSNSSVRPADCCHSMSQYVKEGARPRTTLTTSATFSASAKTSSKRREDVGVPPSASDLVEMQHLEKGPTSMKSALQDKSTTAAEETVITRSFASVADPNKSKRLSTAWRGKSTSGTPGDGRFDLQAQFEIEDEAMAAIPDAISEDEDPKKRLVIRKRYVRGDENKATRDYVIKKVIMEAMDFPILWLRAVIQLDAFNEIDVCLRHQVAYHRFWSNCRIVDKLFPNLLTGFQLVPLFKADTRVLTITFRTTVVLAEDVSIWLERHVAVLMGPHKRKDQYGFWTGDSEEEEKMSSCWNWKRDAGEDEGLWSRRMEFD
ncbi:uncharacterized protein LOC128342473 [Hemicordylus capensis]|uniref:uncharacterized protein LOC128342473 n=1 Tax=Hemicordylus capensis TaxID=884348 RepID=UPI002302A536|nr:uncharacterized protein LOC128342473 [Hemicordylus capensis]